MLEQREAFFVVGIVLQIPNQLNFFTKIGDFLHARLM